MAGNEFFLEGDFQFIHISGRLQEIIRRIGQKNEVIIRCFPNNRFILKFPATWRTIQTVVL